MLCSSWRRASRCSALGSLLFLAACQLGTADAPETSDSGDRDVGSGIGEHDAGSDAGSETGSDAGSDAGNSGVRDAGVDGGHDAATDAGRDPATDAGRDAGSSGADAGTGATFHVFLLLGQSNMAGYAKAQEVDKAENPRIRVLGYDDCSATGRKKDQWDTAAPPLHECWNGALGPGDYFSKTLIDAIPAGHTIGLVPCAISGERIETFLKAGGAKYGWILQRARLAQQAGGAIEGIIFHQGESNCTDPSWPDKVKTLVADLRTDLGIGSAPFLAGELVYDGACARHNTLVNKLPGLISNAYVVSASGLALDPADTQWRLHFSHDAQVTFGKRYGATMIEALRW